MDDRDERLRLLEAGQIVHDLRLNEIESWRRRDEPRVAKLSTAAEIGDAVRTALQERGRREWSWLQKCCACFVGAVVLSDTIVHVLQALGLL